MASLLWLRVLLPLAVLCLGRCLSEETLSQVVSEEDPQGDDAAASAIIHPVPEHEIQICNYEDDLRFTPMMEKDEWDERENTLTTVMPVNYVVVVDGGKHCETHAECLDSLPSELQQTADDACRTRDSFYIGGDGEVYEGRGWHVAPYWHLNGMRRKAVTVKFLGEHGSEGPSERVMRAFWRLVKSGVWQRKLSAGYSIISMGHIYNDTTLAGKALEKVFQESSVGLKDFNQMTTWETTPSDSSLALITREEWGAQKPTKPLTTMGHRLKYVMINEGGERCFTPEECKSRIKAEQEEQQPIYGDLVDNFYIGDDGYVYEGRGYSYKPLWDTEIAVKDEYFKDESMTIRLFGNFQSDMPSEKAIAALKLLAKTGVSSNKLPGNYKIYSFRGIYNDTRFLGDGFFRIARKWTPWATELDDYGAQLIGMFKRTDWGAKDPTKKYGQIKHPVGYVIVNDNSGHDRCFNSNECVSVMKEIRETDQERYGDVEENFYISDTGNVYEGRGWDTESHCQPKYFNGSLITVNFIGNHKEVGASTPALAAFDKLIRVGVKLGKIAPNHQFYSFRNVYDADSLLGEELKKRFEKNERWSKKLDTMTENERLDSGLLPVIPNTDWSDVSTQESYLPYTDPIRYVVIGHKGERCYTHEECTGIMKGYNEGSKEGVPDNFYIGDDGMAYEGRGWMFAPSMYSKGFTSAFYYVAFLGQHFNESAPPKLSILALNRLLENGVRAQKLSPDFKIISLHQILEVASTDHLHNVIMTWDRWTPDFSVITDVEVRPSGNTLFVPRADWQAKPPAAIPALQHPVSHVVVHNVGDHCIDISSCARAMQAIQKNTPPRYKDVPDNFYVGDDGRIYEGRGWHHSSLWATKGVENKFLSVGFLGTFESSPPSTKALLAFYIFQQAGIIKGALKHDYKVIPMSAMITYPVMVSDKLLATLNVSDHWSNEFDLRYDPARLRSLTSPLVLSDEWNLSQHSIYLYTRKEKPIKHIMILNGGESCDTEEACSMHLLKYFNENINKKIVPFEVMLENFYVGNDGNVYEGSGWDWALSGGIATWETTVTVQFFGIYERKLPSAKAIDAFNTVIIKDGLATGKLSSDYKILPIVEGDGRNIGTKLREEVMTWKNSVATTEVG